MKLFVQTIQIAKKDLQIAVSSPLMYVFCFVGTLLVGVFFYLSLLVSPEANLRMLTVNMALSNIVLMPMLGMRMFAEEEKQGTLEMLIGLPGSLWALVLGKFLMGLVVSSSILLTACLYTGVLSWLGTPDWGAIATALLGQGLCMSVCLSISMCASTVTKEPMAAGLVGALGILPMWISDSLMHTIDNKVVGMLVQDISLMQHLVPLSKGILDVGDVFWFVAVTGIFLWTTERFLELKRCQ